MRLSEVLEKELGFPVPVKEDKDLGSVIRLEIEPFYHGFPMWDHIFYVGKEDVVLFHSGEPQLFLNARILEVAKDFLAFKYNGGLYVFVAGETPITVMDYGFKVVDRKAYETYGLKVFGKHRSFPLEEDSIESTKRIGDGKLGALWHAVDKVKDLSELKDRTGDYYVTGQYEYYMGDDGVYVFKGYFIKDGRLFRDGMWQDLPRTIAKRAPNNIIDFVPYKEFTEVDSVVFQEPIAYGA